MYPAACKEASYNHMSRKANTAKKLNRTQVKTTIQSLPHETTIQSLPRETTIQSLPCETTAQSGPCETPVIHNPSLIAYRDKNAVPMRLVPATAARSWMDATDKHFARRCLPMLMSNQAGWFILNSHTLLVTWDGGDALSSLQIECLEGTGPHSASSHFGYGILTWRLPYLFRTPPGINLLARGPANWPKDGAYALEGLVETDWSMAPFTMNWRVTRPNQHILFRMDEPICMIVPQPRGALEAFQPEIRDIETAPEISQDYLHWSESRRQFLIDLKVPGSEAAAVGWQKDYFQGTTPDGKRFTEHQTRLHLRNFAEANTQTP
jgi:Family of unknown function (DUF6065)